MGVAVAVRQAELSVAPGSEAAAEVRIRNTGGVVDQIELDVLGDAAGWATVVPPRVNLLPGQEATARVVFAPPRSPKVTAGETPYALRAMSREDTAGSVIEEASVTVEPFGEVVAEILPRTSRGSRQGRHQLAVDNLGNRPMQVSIVATDPDQLLDFRIERSGITATQGTATFVRLRAVPRKRFLKGPDRTLPFEVTIVAEGAEPVTLPAALLQRSILPPWFLKAVLALLALLIAFIVLWHTLLKPEVKSTAKQVAIAQTAPLAAEVAAATDAANAASAKSDVAMAAAGVSPADAAAAGAAGAAGKSGKGSATAVGAAAGATGGVGGATLDPAAAIDFRMEIETQAGQSRTVTYTHPSGKLLWISDIVLQNPRGDSGFLRIQRGDTVLFEFGLNNFRDLDYHLIQPMKFSPTATVAVTVECANTAAACKPSVYFTGHTAPDPAGVKADRAAKPAAGGSGTKADTAPTNGSGTATGPAGAAGTGTRDAAPSTATTPAPAGSATPNATSNPSGS